MPAPLRHATSKIGLLGGSFNPPHPGHREISMKALDWLGLDSVWWLVSPGNPLKDPETYAPYEERLWRSRRIANDPRIVISNFEERRKLQYTVDTLDALTDLWPDMRFVWLMGADSLATMHLWKDWKRIFTIAPIAAFKRPGFEDAAETSPAAREFAPFRVDERNAKELPLSEPPAWTFCTSTANPASSTALRKP